MSFTNIISLLGGLGAFLFGMQYMGDGLQIACGSRMKDLLEKLTRNRILGCAGRRIKLLSIIVKILRRNLTPFCGYRETMKTMI